MSSVQYHLMLMMFCCGSPNRRIALQMTSANTPFSSSCLEVIWDVETKVIFLSSFECKFLSCEWYLYHMRRCFDFECPPRSLSQAKVSKHRFQGHGINKDPGWPVSDRIRNLSLSQTSTVGSKQSLKIKTYLIIYACRPSELFLVQNTRESRLNQYKYCNVISLI